MQKEILEKDIKTISVPSKIRHKWVLHISYANNFRIHLKKNITISPHSKIRHNPANIYFFNVNDRSTTKRCSKLRTTTTKTPKRRHLRRSGVFIVNFVHISHLFLVFLRLNFNNKMLAKKWIKAPWQGTF